MAWNIRVIYHVLCVTIPHVTMYAIAMNGTCAGTNVQLTFVIHQQVTYKNMSNSVHNSENYTRNALTKVIAHVSLSTVVLNSRDRQGMYGMQHFRAPINKPHNSL